MVSGRDPTSWILVTASRQMNHKPGRKHTYYYRFEDLVEEIKGQGASVCPVAFLVEDEIGNVYYEPLSEQFKSALMQGIE